MYPEFTIGEGILNKVIKNEGIKGFGKVFRGLFRGVSTAELACGDVSRDPNEQWEKALSVGCVMVRKGIRSDVKFGKDNYGKPRIYYYCQDVIGVNFGLPKDMMWGVSEEFGVLILRPGQGNTSSLHELVSFLPR